MTQDIAASVRARLLNRARAEQTNFQLLLDRYGCERFLYRLGESAFKDKCILKGASLLALWMDEPYRATRDIDLLAYGDNDQEAVRELITSICGIPCPDDGIALDISALRISAIQEGQRYAGQRATFIGYLGNARCNIQVDFGFGDVVIPDPEEALLPTLIENLPAPALLVYPQVTTIAEKFEAMVQLGSGNSRMKDFYDIWALSEEFSFDGTELRQAVAQCFERRRTPLIGDMPEVLTRTFYSSTRPQSYWTAYLNDGRLLTPPPTSFEEIGERIQAFLGPVRNSIIENRGFDLHWSPTGPWRQRDIDNGG